MLQSAMWLIEETEFFSLILSVFGEPKKLIYGSLLRASVPTNTELSLNYVIYNNIYFNSSLSNFWQNY